MNRLKFSLCTENNQQSKLHFYLSLSSTGRFNSELFRSDTSRKKQNFVLKKWEWWKQTDDGRQYFTAARDPWTFKKSWGKIQKELKKGKKTFKTTNTHCSWPEIWTQYLAIELKDYEKSHTMLTKITSVLFLWTSYEAEWEALKVLSQHGCLDDDSSLILK